MIAEEQIRQVIQLVKEAKELVKDLLDNYPAADVIYALAVLNNDHINLNVISALTGMSVSRIRWKVLQKMIEERCIWVSDNGIAKPTPMRCESLLAITLYGLLNKGAYTVKLAVNRPSILYAQKRAATTLVKRGIAMVVHNRDDEVTLVANPYFYYKVAKLLDLIKQLEPYVNTQ